MNFDKIRLTEQEVRKLIEEYLQNNFYSVKWLQLKAGQKQIDVLTTLYFQVLDNVYNAVIHKLFRTLQKALFNNTKKFVLFYEC